MNNKENDKWGGLSLRDKAALMKVYVSSGTSSMKEMREHYNTYANGGKINIFDDGGEESTTSKTFTKSVKTISREGLSAISTFKPEDFGHISNLSEADWARKDQADRIEKFAQTFKKADETAAPKRTITPALLRNREETLADLKNESITQRNDNTKVVTPVTGPDFKQTAEYKYFHPEAEKGISVGRGTVIDWEMPILNSASEFLKNQEHLQDVPYVGAALKKAQDFILDKRKASYKTNANKTLVSPREAIMNAEQDILYQNDWLFDVPILGDWLKEKAIDYGKNSEAMPTLTFESYKDIKQYNEENGSAGYTGIMRETEKNKNFNLMDEYASPDKSLPLSKRAPVDDYLPFLNTYDIKSVMPPLTNQDIRSTISGIMGRGKYMVGQNLSDEDLDKAIQKLMQSKRPVFKNHKHNSHLADISGINLAGHKTGMNYDESVGFPYISISDAWDFSPEDYGNKWGRDMQIFAKTGKETPEEIEEYRAQAREQAKIQAALMHKSGYPGKSYGSQYFDPVTKEPISDEEVDRIFAERNPGKTWEEVHKEQAQAYQLDRAFKEMQVKESRKKAYGGKLNTFAQGGYVNTFGAGGQEDVTNPFGVIGSNISTSRAQTKPISNQLAGLDTRGIATPQSVGQQNMMKTMAEQNGIQPSARVDTLQAAKPGTFSTGTDERTSAQRNTDYFHPLKGAAERNKSRYQAGNSVWNGLETMANVGAEGIVNMVGGKAATGLAQGTIMAKPVIGKTLGAASEVTGITPAYMMGNNTKVNQDMGRAQDYLVGQVKSGVSNTFNKATTGVGNMFNSAKTARGFALGGPLYNEDNPIEGFQGNNYIPAVRYSLGGRVLKRRKSKK